MYLSGAFIPLMMGPNPPVPPSPPGPPVPPVSLGLIAHYSADYGVTLTGAEITGVTDLSGTGNHLAGNPGIAPIMPASPGTHFVGRNSMYFDGTKLLQITGGGNTIGYSGGQQTTIYAVVRNPTQLFAGRVLMELGDNQWDAVDHGWSIQYGLASGNSIAAYIKGDVGIQATEIIFGNENKPTILSIRMDKASTREVTLTARVNGYGTTNLSDAGNNNTNGFQNSRLTIGQQIFGNNWIGAIGTILIYNRALDAVEDGFMTAWLKSQYSIT